MTPGKTVALFVFLSACGSGLPGQGVKPSQHATVSQTIANTVVTIVYNRPVARGRTLFGPGGVVRYGVAWDPGADQATSIEFSEDVLINGEQLAAGKYSIWAIPNPDEWIFIFSRAAAVFHIPYPGADKDALRLSVTPETGAYMETLAFYFPVVDGREATLRLHWGETIIPLEIETK